MKTYYCVTSTFDNKGRCFASITEERECETVPDGSFRSTKKADYYTDWFDSYTAAKAFIKGVLEC